MSMNNLSILLDNLLLNSSKKIKIRLLNEYFEQANSNDRGWTLSIITNSIKKKNIHLNDLKNLIKNKIPSELFELSYDYVGDIAETISLLWPKNKSPNFNLKLSDFMNNIFFIDDKKTVLEKLENIFNSSTSSQIYTIIKIITGGLRVGVSNGLVRESLVAFGNRSSIEIEEVWHGFTYPFFDFFEWLLGASLPKGLKKEDLFHSFMLAKSIDNKIFLEDPRDFVAEYKWDGIRAQMIVSSKFKLFSRNSEDITDSFPDLKFNSNDNYIIDGELVIKKENEILPFNILQKRIRRKKITNKILNELPAHFIAYDILYFKGKKCTNMNLNKRKDLLSKFISKINKDNITFSPSINFSKWKELEFLMASTLNNHIEGLMIKRIVTKYEKGRVANSWFKWKKEPYTIDFVLMYAQRGHGKRSSFYSDFTFGCWVDNAFDKLVPIGKAYSGFSNEELNQLDKWVRNNTLERFGPVRSLKSTLVVEISFDNINHSDRHKSGVALRFPRFSRIRWDKPVNEVCILKDIKSLIN